MSVKWIDGFEGDSSSGFGTQYESTTGSLSNTNGSSPTAPRGQSAFGSYFFMNVGASSTGAVHKTLSFSGAPIIGCGVFLSALPGAACGIMRVREGSTIHVEIAISTTGLIAAYRGGVGGTLLGTASANLSFLTDWRMVEAKVLVDDSAGTVEVWVDDEKVLDLSGQDTRNGGTGVVDNVGVGRQTSTTGSLGFDDFYVIDSGDGTGRTSRIGSAFRVENLFPNAAGDLTEWAPSTGSNFQCVDEAFSFSSSDTDYVSSSTTGHRDLYNVASMGGNTPSAIVCVKPLIAARKDDAGARTIRSLVKSNGTVGNGGSHTLTTTYQHFGSIYENDPGTGVPFVPADIASLQIGVENL